VLASLVVFVVYVTATMRLLQVSWVVTAVADETRRALRMSRPVAASYLSASACAAFKRSVRRQTAAGGGLVWEAVCRQVGEQLDHRAYAHSM
jgi:hypothetical protein